ncbi:MAG: HEPN domain-containing protein [Chloroflexia bacterium]|nr:HEPN domain-containing protein [Chloroflexia bacterium]
MVSKQFPPTDPRAWLRRAQSNLTHAKTRTPGVELEVLLFNAQQSAEMAIKAVFIVQGFVFPYVHDLAELLRRLDHAGVDIPLAVREASQLTRYALTTRYPYVGDPATENNYSAALAIAEAVVAWAAERICPDAPAPR